MVKLIAINLDWLQKNTQCQMTFIHLLLSIELLIIGLCFSLT